MMAIPKRRAERLSEYRVHLPPSVVKDLRRKAAEMTLKDGRERDWVAVAREMIRKGLQG